MIESLRAITDVQRVPPQAIEAEQALLGGLLLDNAAWDRIVGCVGEADFYRAAHRTIFRHTVALIERNMAADVLTLAESIERDGELEEVGGRAYIGSLSINTPSAANISRYADIVRDRAIMRSLATLAGEVAERAYSLEDPRALAEEAEDRFLAIRDADIGGRELVRFSTALSEAVDALDEPDRGISTGLANLDAIARPNPGALWVLAGRPSMGKSALVGAIAECVGEMQPALVFTLEMTRRDWAARSLSYHTARIGKSAAVTHLLDRQVWIDDSPAISVGYIRSRAKRLKRQHGLALIVVDYLQLMTAQGENRTQEIAAVSRGLKALAKEFDVPVIAVSQLSRGVESRNDRRPVMADLRESGQIEQDADVIGFVYREELYNEAPEVKGLAELIVRKNRNGRTGTAHLTFDAAHTRFADAHGVLPNIGAVSTPLPRSRPFNPSGTVRERADIDG